MTYKNTMSLAATAYILHFYVQHIQEYVYLAYKYSDAD